METAREIGAFLRRLFWYGVIGGLPFLFDLADFYEGRIKGGPLDPAFLAEPWVGWVAWLTATVNEYLFVVLLVVGSFLVFRDERRDRQSAESAQRNAEKRTEQVESDLGNLRRLYDGLVARGVGEMWSRREPSTGPEQPPEPPAIEGPVSIEGSHTSTTPPTRRSRRKTRRDPPDQPPLPGL